jgi:hypothetical protein
VVELVDVVGPGGAGGTQAMATSTSAPNIGTISRRFIMFIPLLQPRSR